MGTIVVGLDQLGRLRTTPSPWRAAWPAITGFELCSSGLHAGGYCGGYRDPEVVLGGAFRAPEAASALWVHSLLRSMMTFRALVSAARSNVS